MTCREVTEFLMRYLDGELAGDQRHAFERHLEVCPPCLAYLRSYIETVRLVAETGGGEPREVPAELLRAVLSARSIGD